jgi:hypothetical protein
MDRHLKDKGIMNICEDMGQFILKEIVHLQGNYHDDTSELAQPEYQDLVDFARLELNKDDYYGIHGTYKLKTLMYAMFDVYTRSMTIVL